MAPGVPGDGGFVLRRGGGGSGDGTGCGGGTREGGCGHDADVQGVVRGGCRLLQVRLLAVVLTATQRRPRLVSRRRHAVLACLI